MNWNLIGIFLAGIFFITTLTLTLKYRRVKKLVWSYKTKKVIGLGSNAPPELQLMFGRRRITDLYQTDIMIFNAGNESLRRNDITEDITVRFEGAEILRPPIIIAKSKEAIRFTTKAVKDNNDFSLELNFLYLDHNDGAVIEVLHSKSEKLSCSGNVIGVKKIYYRGEYQPRPPSFRASFNWRDFAGPLLTLMLLSLIILITSFGRGEPIASIFEKYTMAFYLLGGMVLGGLLGSLVKCLDRYSFWGPFPRWSIIKD